jgi:hypothetical protein
MLKLNVIIYRSYLSFASQVLLSSVNYTVGFYCITSLAHDPSKLTGMNLSVLDRNTVYCSIIFANRIEIQNLSNFFMKEIKFENIFMATEARFLPNAPTQTRPPDSRLLPNADSARPHHRRHHNLVSISCYQSHHRQNLISIFPHCTNGALVESSLTDIGYYIRSRCLIALSG